MTTFHFGGVDIDAISYATAGNAILGIRDSGKTYTATALAELLFDAGIPFIAFDPIGVWRFLRHPGEHGRGYPIVVAGGAEGDLALTPASAPQIVEAAMANGISLVIDLFSIDLSKADWKSIVRDCVRLLLHRNKAHGLRHVFIEEAAEFAPQKIGYEQGQVYAEIEKLARMGGNSRLGYTLINQRAEEVNKAVLELCDNLFLHRQKGRRSLEALSKWLDVGNVREGKAIIESLSTLPTGEAWAWMQGADHATRIKVPAKRSLHPDRRVMRDDAGAEVKPAVDVGKFVDAMRAALAKTAPAPEERKAKKIAPAAEAPPERARALAEAYEEGFRHGWNFGIARGNEAVDTFRRKLGSLETALAEAVRPHQDPPPQARAKIKALQTRKPDPSRHPDPEPSRQLRAKSSQPPVEIPASLNGQVGKGPLAMLAALRRCHPEPLTQAEWAVLAVFKRSGGTWRTYVSQLRTQGFIAQDGDRFSLTAAGLAAVPSPAEFPVADAWKQKLGSTPGRMLDALIEVFPETLDKANLADKARMIVEGGSFRTYLSKLKSNGLIEIAGKRRIKASEALFL